MAGKRRENDAKIGAALASHFRLRSQWKDTQDGAVSYPCTAHLSTS